MVTELLRNQGRIFNNLNDQLGITFNPDVGSVPDISCFKSQNNRKKFSKKSVVNANIGRKSTKKMTQVITEDATTASMPGDPLAEPSVLHLMVLTAGGDHSTCLMICWWGGWMLTEKDFKMLNCSMEDLRQSLEMDPAREVAAKILTMAVFKGTELLLNLIWLRQYQMVETELITKDKTTSLA